MDTSEQVPARRRRGPWIAGGAAVLVLAGAVTTGLLLGDRSEPAAPAAAPLAAPTTTWHSTFATTTTPAVSGGYDERGYMATLVGNGVPYAVANRDANVSLGYAVCTALGRGVSYERIKAANSTMADKDVDVVIAAAAANLCPQYQDKVLR